MTARTGDSTEREHWWSWAESERDVNARRRHAAQLAGERIHEVVYYTLDYRREPLHPEWLGSGPRTIESETEWSEPLWRCADFDTLDHGLELHTESGRKYSLTWDPTGDHEGIGLRRAPMLGSVLVPDADVALWQVGRRTDLWRPFMDRPLTAVELHYFPDSTMFGGFRCPRISFHAGNDHLDIVLGDGDDDGLGYSADNIAVLHPGTPVPPWGYGP
ncbi:hypothetical protein AB0L57_08145 [Nocardia sp. NPDC052254]|uniref:hypothetical protein n=1 Tax=Nocardia sp. NPDC052254 TaxID=3155681 RepID=UPI00343A0285